MRLINRRTDGGPVLAVAIGDDAVDAAALGSGIPATIQQLVDGVPEALEALHRAVASASSLAESGAPRRPLDSVKFAPPVGRVGKIIAVGRNYRDHAAEQGVEVASDPILFSKFPSSISGHEDEIRWRAADSGQVDYEAELAVVIGRRVRDVRPEEALGAVLGYTALNDVSARDLQFGDGQWVRGKSLDTFCPIGPWLVTADEIPDPGALRIQCHVNGETLQDARTSDLIHDVPTLIAFCSRFMTLEPGDVIATGTPGGVGVFRDPPRFLGDGDEVIVEIEGIGPLRNVCRVVDG